LSIGELPGQWMRLRSGIWKIMGTAHPILKNHILRRFAIFLVAFPTARGADSALPPGPAAGAAAVVRRIWDRAPYNSFTDLIRFQGRWYCVLREGKAHVSPDGALRVIASEDGAKWEPVARMSYEGGDLRDGKLSVMPNGRLLLSGAVRFLKPRGGKTHQSLCWTTADGKSWSERQEIGDSNYWLWSVAWLPAVQGNAQQAAGHGYSFGYKTVKPYGLRLYRLTADGGQVTSDAWVADIEFPAAYPNETSLVFAADGTGYCLLRTEAHAWLGTSAPPYKEWNWKEADRHVGGPKMIQLPDGRLLGGGRLKEGGSHTGIVSLDFAHGRITEIMKLPSGGDTSYPGMVVHDGTLWMSYYSGHEGKTGIYLARIPLAQLLTVAAPDPAAVGTPVAIGNRRELFVDDSLFATLKGSAALKLHRPEPREVVFVTDQPWEGNTCAYYTLFQDGDRYRMFYRASHSGQPSHPEFACYAERTAK